MSWMLQIFYSRIYRICKAKKYFEGLSSDRTIKQEQEVSILQNIIKSPVCGGCCSTRLFYLSLRQIKWSTTKSQIIFHHHFSVHCVFSLISSDVYSLPVYIKCNIPSCKLRSPLSLISNWKLKCLIKYEHCPKEITLNSNLAKITSRDTYMDLCVENPNPKLLG